MVSRVRDSWFSPTWGQLQFWKGGGRVAPTPLLLILLTDNSLPNLVGIPATRLHILILCGGLISAFLVVFALAFFAPHAYF